MQQKILKARVISGYGNTAFLLSGEFDMLFIKKKTSTNQQFGASVGKAFTAFVKFIMAGVY